MVIGYTCRFAKFNTCEKSVFKKICESRNSIPAKFNTFKVTTLIKVCVRLYPPRTEFHFFEIVIRYHFVMKVLVQGRFVYAYLHWYIWYYYLKLKSPTVHNPQSVFLPSWIRLVYHSIEDSVHFHCKRLQRKRLCFVYLC